MEYTTGHYRRVYELSSSFTVDKCAEILGFTERALYKIASNLGVSFLRKQRFYAEDIAFMMELKSKGFSTGQVAAIFRVKPKKITDAIYNAGKYGFDKYPKRANTNKEMA